MIGYEFEFFAVDSVSFEPISREQFERFHKLLTPDGWQNVYDPVTGYLTYSKRSKEIIKTDDSILIFEIPLSPTETIGESDRAFRELLCYVNEKLALVGACTFHFGAYPRKT